MENSYQENKNNYINLVGGTIRTAKAYTILGRLTPAHGIAPGDKRAINAIVSDGHKNAGVLFIGSLSNEPDKLRILCGKEYRIIPRAPGAPRFAGVADPTGWGFLLNAFGGKIDAGETILRGMIRETIEEIFNFKPSPAIIASIESYLNGHGSDSYQIVAYDRSSYTYIFDISTLGNFIEQMNNNGETRFNKYMLRGSFPPGDQSSVTDNMFTNFIGCRSNSLTIDLPRFMQERPVPTVRPGHGLNEYYAIGFPVLDDLQTRARATGKYNFFNEVTKTRESLAMTDILMGLIERPSIIQFR